MSSAVCSGCSSHGGCQVASATRLVSRAQIFGDGLRGGFGGRQRSGALDGDDEFARIGKMLLVNFESLNGGNIRGQQVENLGIEVQPRKSERNRNRAAAATTSETISWEKFALQSFAGARIFQPPRIGRHVL